MNASVYIDVLDKIFRMTNDYMNEPGDVNDQTDDRMITDQDEEQSEINTFTFGASAHSASIIGACFNDDDDEDERDEKDDDEVGEDRENDGENNDDDGNCDNDSDAEDNDDVRISEDGFVDNDVQSTLLSVKEISAAIVLFRHRHHLTKFCINDLCDLLRFFSVENVSADFRCIQGNLTQRQGNIVQFKTHFVCPNCSHKGTDSSKCQNNDCKLKTGFISNPTTLCTFRRLPQITSVLERHSVMLETNERINWKINDVQEGQA